MDFLHKKDDLAEGDGEPSIVAVVDLNAVVSRAPELRKDHTKTFYTHRKNFVLYIISTFVNFGFISKDFPTIYK